MYVCSIHFKPEDIKKTETKCSLNHEAVPSINVGTDKIVDSIAKVEEPSANTLSSVVINERELSSTDTGSDINLKRKIIKLDHLYRYVI